MFLFIIKGCSECSSPPLLKRQDLDTEPEVEMEKVEGGAGHTTVATETSGREAAGAEQEETIAFGQSRDISSASQARPDKVIVAPCRSQCAKSGVEDTESESQCPVLERSVCPDTKGNNQIAVAGTHDNQLSLTAKHPGKVIMTDVTINSLTVTFLEATVAEGFFKGH